jgi:hypothetical protein
MRPYLCPAALLPRTTRSVGCTWRAVRRDGRVLVHTMHHQDPALRGRMSGSAVSQSEVRRT